MYRLLSNEPIWETSFLKKSHRLLGPPDVPGHMDVKWSLPYSQNMAPRRENAVPSRKPSIFCGSRARSPGAAGRNSCPYTLQLHPISESNNLGKNFFEKISSTRGTPERPGQYCAQYDILAQRRGPAQRRKSGFVNSKLLISLDLVRVSPELRAAIVVN